MSSKDRQRQECVERAKDLKGKRKAIILHGNGTGDMTDGNWYPSVRDELEAAGIPVLLTTYPDSLKARCDRLSRI